MKNSREIVRLIIGLLLSGFSFGNTVVSAAPPVKEDPHAGVTQNWDKVLPSAQRFTVLESFNNAAVRDNETGLVWERAPSSGTANWSSAASICLDKNVGGRRGWRLPSIPELASLQDPSVATAPILPPGHPFLNVQPSEYWSGTTTVDVPTAAWVVFFNSNGDVGGNGKGSLIYYWCVRGPMSADAY